MFLADGFEGILCLSILTTIGSTKRVAPFIKIPKRLHYTTLPKPSVCSCFLVPCGQATRGICPLTDYAFWAQAKNADGCRKEGEDNFFYLSCHLHDLCSGFWNFWLWSTGAGFAWLVVALSESKSGKVAIERKMHQIIEWALSLRGMKEVLLASLKVWTFQIWCTSLYLQCWINVILFGLLGEKVSRVIYCYRSTPRWQPPSKIKQDCLHTSYWLVGCLWLVLPLL